MQAAVPPRAQAEPWVHPALRANVSSVGATLGPSGSDGNRTALFGGGVSIPSGSAGAAAAAGAGAADAAVAAGQLDVVGVFQKHVRALSLPRSPGRCLHLPFSLMFSLSTHTLKHSMRPIIHKFHHNITVFRASR